MALSDANNESTSDLLDISLGGPNRVQLDLFESVKEGQSPPEKSAQLERTKLTPADKAWLESRGITGQQQSGITRITEVEDLPKGFSGWGKAVVPCLCFRWVSVDGREAFQLKPDKPFETDDGEVHKYLFGKGHQNILAVPPGYHDAVMDPTVPLLILEGTKQHLAAASALEGERYAIVGTAGCWGHRVGRDNQSSALVPCFRHIPLENRQVFLGLDADRGHNRAVYDAAQDQRDSCVIQHGAASVRFIEVPGKGKADLDDLLSQYPTKEERQKLMRRLLDNALDKQGREPSRKTAKNRPFVDSDTGKLLVADLYEALSARAPLGVHNVGENKASLLVYRNGKYHNGKEREFENNVTVLLKNDFEPRHLNNVREFAISRLVQQRCVITARQDQLWINFKNGVLDVMTLELEPHDPSRHAFLNQVPYDWNPSATCPYYEEWINERIPGQVEVYEDAASQVLDWRKEAMKAPFLFGCESTGKTTALWYGRLMIGEKNTAKLSLQEIGHNDFAAAELNGKLLNICGDLERDEIRSLATFKQLTGGDGKTANKKFGDYVELDWIGTFMFSANQIPSISGDPGSYLKRVQPIWFKRTYSGDENPEIGRRLRERPEVEGVIVRWVMALQAHELRGGYLKPDPEAAAHFGSRSDQVRRFLMACTTEVPHKDGEEKGTILNAFERWAKDNHCGMGRNTFYGRLDTLGYKAKKVKDLSGRRFPLILKDEDDWDSYDDADDPDPDSDVNPSDTDGNGRFPLLVPTISGPSGGSKPSAQQAVPTIPRLEAQGVSVAARREGVDGEVVPSGGNVVEVQNREYREPPVTPTVLKGKTPEKNREPKQGTKKPLVLPPIAEHILEPKPEAYTGEVLRGINYVCTAEDLPDPRGVALLAGFDLETFNRRRDLLRHEASLFPFLGGEIRLAQICDGRTTLVVDVAVIGQPALDWLSVVVRDPARVLVGHNLLFEATHLIAAGIRPLCQWWDTMLANQTLGDYPGDTLKACVKNYSGRDLDKEEQTSDWGNGLTAKQIRYAAQDAVVVLPLREVLAKALEDSGQTEVHRLDCQVINPAADGQVRGLAIDILALARIETETKKELAPKLDALYAALEPHGLPPRGKTNPHGGKFLVPAMNSATGLEFTTRAYDKKSGQWTDKPSCQSDVLNLYKGVPLVDLLLEIKDLEAVAKQVVQLRRDVANAGGRTRPNYKVLGANTGRMTTSGQISANKSVPSDTEVFGPDAVKAGQPVPVKLPQIGCNFQGFNSRLKAALGTGNPDSLLVDADWAGQEIRLQASPVLYNDSGYRREVLLDEDSHTKMALTLFGLPRPKGDVIKKLDGCTEAQRSAAKPANFSLPYGCGAASLRGRLSAAQGSEVPLHKAEAMHAQWHKDHQEVSGEMDYCKRHTIYERRSIAGRRICSRSKTPKANGTLPKFKIGPTSGANWPVQASAKDMLADCLADLWPALDHFPGVHIVGLIHDEILVEAPRDVADEVQAIVVGCMTSARLQERYLGDIPLKASAKAGETWGEVH